MRPSLPILTFVVSAFMQQEATLQLSSELFFYQDSGTEYAESSVVTFYRTVVDACSTGCPRVPKNAVNITIVGSGFGENLDDVSVRLSPSGSCVVREVSEHRIVCGVSSDLPLGALKAQVFRGPQPQFVSSWMDAYLVTVAEVVETPSLQTTASQVPYNIPALVLQATNLGASPSIADFQVILSVGSGVSCPVISINNNTVTCDSSGIIPSDVRGTVAAQLIRRTGPSASTIVGTIVAKPSIISDVSRKLAANTVNITIRGSNFGSDRSSVSVVLFASSSRRSIGAFQVNATVLSVSGDEILLAVPAGSLPLGVNFTATVYRLGAPSDSVFLGQVVETATLASSSRQIAVNSPTLTIAGVNFADDSDFVSVVLETSSSTSIPCPVQTSSFNAIVCLLPENLPLGVLSATVFSYGGPSVRAVVAEIVSAPTIRASTTDSIKPNTTELTIVGEGFSTADPATNNQAFVSYNILDASQSKRCAIVSATAQQVFCHLSAGDLNTTGSLFARVQSHGGYSNWTQIGVVGDSTAAVVNAPIAPGIIAAIVVVVVVLVLALIIGGVLVARYLKGLRERNAQQQVPKEMEYMFNIRASDLQVLSKLGGPLSDVFFFLAPAEISL